MKKIIPSLLFFLLLPIICYSTDQIVIIGDSVTSAHVVKKEESYHYLLQQTLNPLNVKLVTCGVGGMNSGGGYSILSSLYDSFYPDAFNPRVAVLAIGINDVAWIKPEQTQKAFELFIELALDHGCIPVIGRIDPSFLYPNVSLEKIRL